MNKDEVYKQIFQEKNDTKPTEEEYMDDYEEPYEADGRD